jgi:hypothetical protein
LCGRSRGCDGTLSPRCHFVAISPVFPGQGLRFRLADGCRWRALTGLLTLGGEGQPVFWWPWNESATSAGPTGRLTVAWPACRPHRAMCRSRSCRSRPPVACPRRRHDLDDSPRTTSRSHTGCQDASPTPTQRTRFADPGTDPQTIRVQTRIAHGTLSIPHARATSCGMFTRRHERR